MKTELDLTGLVGVPYFPPGSAALGGMDCWALTREALRRNGVDFPATPESAMLDGPPAPFRRLDAAEPARAGDVLITRLGRDTHVMVMVDGARVLHTVRGACSRVDRVHEIVTPERLIARYRADQPPAGTAGVPGERTP